VGEKGVYILNPTISNEGQKKKEKLEERVIVKKGGLVPPEPPLGEQKKQYPKDLWTLTG